MVLSKLFWPEMKSDAFQLHKALQGGFEGYARQYQKVRSLRTVFALPALGSVDVELAFRISKITLSVSPLHATLVFHFSEKGFLCLQFYFYCL